MFANRWQFWMWVFIFFAPSYEVVRGWRCCIPEDCKTKWQWRSVFICNGSLVENSGSQPLLCSPLQSYSCSHFRSVTLFVFIFFCTIFICVFLLFHKCVFLFLKTTAVTLINSIRHGQWRTDLENRSEATSVPQRIVLLGQGHQRHSKKSFNADMKSQKTSAPTNEPPSLIQSTLAPSIDSNSWLDNISTSQLHNTGTSDDSNSFIDGYTGTKLLIGEHG